MTKQRKKKRTEDKPGEWNNMSKVVKPAEYRKITFVRKQNKRNKTITKTGKGEQMKRRFDNEIDPGMLQKSVQKTISST